MAKTTHRDLRDRELMHKIFIHFLKHENCLHQYWENVISYGGGTLERTLTYARPLTYISGFFIWSSTKQGNAFWGMKNDKWEKICIKIQKI